MKQLLLPDEERFNENSLVVIYTADFFNQFGDYFGLSYMPITERCNEYFFNVLSTNTLSFGNDFIDEDVNILEVEYFTRIGKCTGYRNLSDKFILLNRFYGRDEPIIISNEAA